MLNWEKFNKIQKWFWVPVMRDFRGDRSISGNSFVFSKEKPKPVPNPQMKWEHPTFDELYHYNERAKDKIRKDLKDIYNR